MTCEMKAYTHQINHHGSIFCFQKAKFVKGHIGPVPNPSVGLIQGLIFNDDRLIQDFSLFFFPPNNRIIH